MADIRTEMQRMELWVRESGQYVPLVKASPEALAAAFKTLAYMITRGNYIGLPATDNKENLRDCLIEFARRRPEGSPIGQDRHLDPIVAVLKQVRNVRDLVPTAKALRES